MTAPSSLVRMTQPDGRLKALARAASNGVRAIEDGVRVALSRTYAAIRDEHIYVHCHETLIEDQRIRCEDSGAGRTSRLRLAHESLDSHSGLRDQSSTSRVICSAATAYPAHDQPVPTRRRRTARDPDRTGNRELRAMVSAL
jgi:hypothetical protein